MPTRFIKESCRTSKNLNACSDFAERLFWRLLTTADDFGRCLGCPSVVRSACFPLNEKLKSETVKKALLELQSHHLITLYQVGDREYCEFVTFSTHQGRPRAKESKYPENPGTSESSLSDASIYMQMHADVTGHPNTNTDTNTDLSSLNSPDEEGVQGEKPDAFQLFWEVYPARNGKKIGKEEAKRKFCRLKLPDQAAVIQAAYNYASSQTARDGYAKDAHRFICAARGVEPWREWLTPEQSSVGISIESTWSSYAEAYKHRYGISPVRNRKADDEFRSFLGRIPENEAPQVAAFYVTHNAQWYVSKMHPVNLLLADAEKLRTEWATGTKMTSVAVKNAEVKDNVVEQVKRVEAIMKGRTV